MDGCGDGQLVTEKDAIQTGRIIAGTQRTQMIMIYADRGRKICVNPENPRPPRACNDDLYATV
jgi:hypothetical protein